VNEYLGIINNYLMSRTRLPRPRRAFYPSETSCIVKNSLGYSEIIGRCLREVYWKWLDEPETNTPSAVVERKFMLGNIAEKAEIEIIKRAGIFVDDHVKFVDEYLGTSGEVDAVINLPKLGLVGLEIKSVWGYQGTTGVIQSTKKTPFFPKGSHLLQVMCYLHHFTEENRIKIPIFKILYIDRGSGESAEHTLRLLEGHPVINGEIWKEVSIDKIKARIDEFYGYLQRKELPPRDFDYEYNHTKIEIMAENNLLNKEQEKLRSRRKHVPVADFQCRYCSFLTKCRGCGGDLRFKDQVNLGY